ncbi:TPA: DUF1343 domain-containing protein, partial [Yersinia enterocolitica]
MGYFLRILLCLYGLFIITTGHVSATQEIILGVDQENIYGPLLKNKRIGLMVNQSSINKEGRHT